MDERENMKIPAHLLTRRGILRVSPYVACAAILGLTSTTALAEDDRVSTRTWVEIAQLESGAFFQDTFVPVAVPPGSLNPFSMDVATDVAPEIKESKRFRRFLALGGGVGGFFAYMPVAIDDGRVGVSDSQRILEWSAVTAGTAIAGYFIGKKLDRRKMKE